VTGYGCHGVSPRVKPCDRSSFPSAEGPLPSARAWEARERHLPTPRGGAAAERPLPSGAAPLPSGAAPPPDRRSPPPGAGSRRSQPASPVTCRDTPVRDNRLMHIQADRAFVPAGVSATRYLSVTLSGPPDARPHEASAPARPGVDVSLVLDRSGSMAGRKIELARRAVAHAVRLLKPSDRLGIVAYDHEVNTVLECQPATAAARAQALHALGRIEARGSTNLAEGWFTGARALGGHPGAEATAGPAESPSDRVRRVLLLTDGLANQGVVDPRELRDAAARLREQGVTTSTFGLGSDFDEELLASLATGRRALLLHRGADRGFPGQRAKGGPGGFGAGRGVRRGGRCGHPGGGSQPAAARAGWACHAGGAG